MSMHNRDRALTIKLKHMRLLLSKYVYYHLINRRRKRGAISWGVGLWSWLDMWMEGSWVRVPAWLKFRMYALRYVVAVGLVCHSHFSFTWWCTLLNPAVVACIDGCSLFSPVCVSRTLAYWLTKQFRALCRLVNGCWERRHDDPTYQQPSPGSLCVIDEWWLINSVRGDAI